MSDTTFTDYTTKVVASWLQDMNDVVYRTSSRTLVKALSTTVGKVLLTESGREGLFVWTLGNFSTQTAADTYEGIYLVANSTPASTGAWVRVVPDNTWHVRWFGMPTDGSSDCSPYINSIIALANIQKPAVIQFSNAIYKFNSVWTTPTYQAKFRGYVSGSQQTILGRNYTEASSYLGLINFGAYGGVLEDLYINAPSGTGGSAFSAVLPGNATNIGQLHLIRVTVSGVNGFNQDVYIDGTAATTAPIGYRQVFFDAVTLFGGTSGTPRNCLVLKGVQHFKSSDTFFQDIVVLSGTSSVPTDNVTIEGMISGSGSTGLSCGTSSSDDYVTRVGITGYLHGNVTNYSTHTAKVRLPPTYPGQLISRNWDLTSCGCLSYQNALEAYEMTIANNGISNFGSQTAIYGGLHITDSDGNYAIFNLKGAAGATSLLAGDATIWSTTSGTASKTNVYWGGTYYQIENKRGASKNYSVSFIGNMTSF